MSRWRILLLLPVCLVLFNACNRLDEEAAALQIRENFCEGWPFGCTESTVVEIGKVRETRHGRAIEFKVVDGEDETRTLSAAYFELQEDVWTFLLFEPPFSEEYNRQKSRVVDDKRLFEEELSELKKAQRWFATIYGRFARDFAELDSVSYTRPTVAIQMTVSPNANAWTGEVRSEYTRCVLEIPRQQIASCEGLSALNTGTSSGPLSTAFGEQ
jgi:hypothetical protein